MSKIKVALLNAGLGNISRGFQTSTAVWFNQIKKDKSLKSELYSGGNYPDAIK